MTKNKSRDGKIEIISIGGKTTVKIDGVSTFDFALQVKDILDAISNTCEDIKGGPSFKSIITAYIATEFDIDDFIDTLRKGQDYKTMFLDPDMKDLMDKLKGFIAKSLDLDHDNLHDNSKAPKRNTKK